MIASMAMFGTLGLFIRAIPYNFYSLLTLVFVVAIVVMKADFGPMAKHERNAIEKGEYNPTIKLCVGICRTLGLTLNDLFWNEEQFENFEKK